MDNPLVSILIPCWGCKEYIREAIGSALAQTYKPIEVIVMEDCGDDGTYEEALKIKDRRLRVYRNERNLGQHGNKNRGLELANGQLIKYLDGDDVLEPSCVAQLVDAWQRGGAGVGIVFGQFTIVDQCGRFVARPWRWGISGRCSGLGVLDRVICMKKLPTSVFGNVTPHLFYAPVLKAIGGFPNDNSWSGDLETFLKLLCITDVVFLPYSVARYRRQPSSVGHTRGGVLAVKDNIVMVERLTVFFENQPNVPAYLRNEGFIRQWKVWASARNIMASYQHKLRRLPNQYDAMRDVFVQRGLASDFDRFARRHFPVYVMNTFVTKLRRALGLPQHRPLFNRRDIVYIRKE